MKFLTPATAVVAAGIAVPLLLLLYFLKLRRRELPISSTLLWKKAVMDLQVNAPFQKLRRNLLLFLQLIVLLLTIAALGTPMMRFRELEKGRKILLIDRSASMNAIEKDAVRLELAKKAARELVRTLARDDEAMVIAFSQRAQVVCPFTKDHRQLSRQIDAIETSDGLSRLGDALQLAMAYANPSRVLDAPGQTPPAATPEAEIELFSDGRLADADSQIIQRGGMRYYKIGEAADNVGVVRLDVRRAYEKPTQLTAFATVRNFGPTAVTTDVSLKLDGATKKVAEVSLGPAHAGSGAAPPGAAPSSRDVLFEIEHESGGTIEVGVERDDALLADNAARAVIDPPRQVAILGVTDRPGVRWAIHRLLRGMLVNRVDWKTPDEYEATPDSELMSEGRPVHDVTIIEHHSTAKVPGGGYIFLGGVPRIEGVSLGDMIEDDAISTYDETHPLLRYVNFDMVTVDKWRDLKLPPFAVPLIEGEKSLVAAYLPMAGRQFLIMAFDIADTDLLMKEAFVPLMFNAVRQLSGAAAAEASQMLQPGDTFVGAPMTAAESVDVIRPDGERDTIPLTPGQRPAFTRTTRVGVYTMKTGDEPTRFAVNLLDENESNIAPNPSLSVGAERIGEGEVVEDRNRPVWPWLIMAALAVIMFEWWIYNRRVML